MKNSDSASEAAGTKWNFDILSLSMFRKFRVEHLSKLSSNVQRKWEMTENRLSACKVTSDTQFLEIELYFLCSCHNLSFPERIRTFKKQRIS